MKDFDLKLLIWIYPGYLKAELQQHQITAHIGQ